MEDKEINGEIVVGEVTMETPGDNSGIDIPVADGSADTAVGTDVTLAEGESSEPDADETVGTEAVVPEYSMENPLPVIIVEEPEQEIEGYALTDTYPGTISETYLDYFRGIVQKLSFGQHYVMWRSGQYEYKLAYGEDIELSGALFTGMADIVEISRPNDYTYYVYTDRDEIYVESDNMFVYSDLGMYPTLKEGVTNLEGLALLFAVGFAVVYSVCHDIFDYVMEHVYRK